MIFLKIIRECIKLMFKMPEVKPECGDADTWTCVIVAVAAVIGVSLFALSAGVVTVVAMI